MIVALLTDSFLRATVRRAALPDEDVFWRPDDVSDALSRGFPRLVIRAEDDPHPLSDPEARDGDLPRVVITPSILRSWRNARNASGFSVSRVDDHGLRLRSLIRATSGPLGWVERLFADLSRASGHSVVGAVRGLGRRVLEFPSRYEDLHAVADLTGLTRGALKARFRRRDLPSPYTYLRWFRALAGAHVLSMPETTTEEAAYRTGLHSSGNFCRYVQDVSGLAPSDLRRPGGRIRMLTRFAEEGLQREHLEAWRSLEDLFLEEAA